MSETLSVETPQVSEANPAIDSSVTSPTSNDPNPVVEGGTKGAEATEGWFDMKGQADRSSIENALKEALANTTISSEPISTPGAGVDEAVKDLVKNDSTTSLKNSPSAGNREVVTTSKKWGSSVSVDATNGLRGGAAPSPRSPDPGSRSVVGVNVSLKKWGSNVDAKLPESGELGPVRTPRASLTELTSSTTSTTTTTTSTTTTSTTTTTTDSIKSTSHTPGTENRVLNAIRRNSLNGVYAELGGGASRRNSVNSSDAMRAATEAAINSAATKRRGSISTSMDPYKDLKTSNTQVILSPEEKEAEEKALKELAHSGASGRAIMMHSSMDPYKDLKTSNTQIILTPEEREAEEKAKRELAKSGATGRVNLVKSSMDPYANMKTANALTPELEAKLYSQEELEARKKKKEGLPDVFRRKSATGDVLNTARRLSAGASTTPGRRKSVGENIQGGGQTLLQAAAEALASLVIEKKDGDAEMK